MSLDTMGLKAEDGCPNGTKELWVTIQAARCHCHFQSLEVVYFLFAQVILYPSGVFDGVEEWLVIVSDYYDKDKIDINILTVILTILLYVILLC